MKRILFIAIVFLSACNSQPKKTAILRDTIYIDSFHKCVVIRHPDGSGVTVQLPDSFFSLTTLNGSNKQGEYGIGSVSPPASFHAIKLDSMLHP